MAQGALLHAPTWVNGMACCTPKMTWCTPKMAWCTLKLYAEGGMVGAYLGERDGMVHAEAPDSDQEGHDDAASPNAASSADRRR